MNAPLPPLKAHAWLYTDYSTMMRVEEHARDDGGMDVILAGSDVRGTRHSFASRAEAAQFRARLERHLAAHGFVELWRSGAAEDGGLEGPVAAV